MRSSKTMDNDLNKKEEIKEPAKNAESAHSKWEDIRKKLMYITALRIRGADTDEICRRLGISKSTFHNYKKKYPEFKEAVSIDREAADGMVEAALLKLATGYTVKTQKVYKLKNTHYNDIGKKEEEERLETAEEEQKVPPNLSAQTFWLKNRCPELWCDKLEKDKDKNEDNGDGGIVILPADEILEVLKNE